jgi:hypothetical protein
LELFNRTTCNYIKIAKNWIDYLTSNPKSGINYSNVSSSDVSSESRNADQERLIQSPSVATVVSRFDPNEPISAAKFTNELFLQHSEYANNMAVSIKLEDTLTKQTAQEWIEKVQRLFDPSRIQELSKSIIQPELHGRLVIIGLAMLDRAIYDQLEKFKAFDALVKELREPLPDILTAEGRSLWDNLKHSETSEPPTPTEPRDSVPNWGDDPLQKLEDDLLGRVAFARYMVKRMAAVKQESGAFVMLLYGPWGAGKSTVMNFIRTELKNKELTSDDWLVVEYNSWRNQHIQPPWWSLMDAVFRSTKGNLNWKDRIREYWWRFYTGRQHFLIGIMALIALIWILALTVLPSLINKTADVSDSESISNIADYADNISKILALVATVWGVILATNKSLLFGSAQAAQSYNDLTADPTGEIKKRFETLIDRLKPKHVVIFIDDLDRCNSDYVVKLLEGIQTLFREASVVFMIAADRRWLNACYEDVYEKLKSRVFEPGKPLGTLFLEKAFRFTAPMPGIPEKLKERYWLYLLQVAPSERKEDLDIARNLAKTIISGAKSEAEVRQLVGSSSKQSFVDQRAIREEAAVKLAAPEIMECLEHTLKPYIELLEPNPRSMKLLVNAYSANRVLAILSEVEIDFHQLVLWTILSSRWPQLASHLEKYPDDLAKIDKKDVTGIPKDLQSLFSEDSEVEYVVHGGSMNLPLTLETIYKCSQLHA